MTNIHTLFQTQLVLLDDPILQGSHISSHELCSHSLRWKGQTEVIYESYHLADMVFKCSSDKKRSAAKYTSLSKSASHQADNTDVSSKSKERNLTCRKSSCLKRAWANLIWGQYCKVQSAYWQHTPHLPFPYLNSLLLPLLHLSSAPLYLLNSNSFTPKYTSIQICWHDSELVLLVGFFHVAGTFKDKK